jgi:predicted nucleic acid-binding protein
LTFFLDANVIIYTGASGPYGDPCRTILRAVTYGEAEGVTSTAVIEEVWHVELTDKAIGIAGLTPEAYTMLRPLLPVTDETVALALSLDASSLGANDRIHVATCMQNGIDMIVSADAGFDGVRGVRRVDPLDERALKRLLHS